MSDQRPAGSERPGNVSGASTHTRPGVAVAVAKGVHEQADAHKTRPTLLLKLRNPGDQKAWAEFVDLYGPDILRWCRRWFPREAEDMVQEVLVKLLSLLRTFVYDPERGRFRDWLETVTKHLMQDLNEKRRRVPVLAASGDSAISDRLNRETARVDLMERLAVTFDLERYEAARERVCVSS